MGMLKERMKIGCWRKYMKANLRIKEDEKTRVEVNCMREKGFN